MKNTNNKFTHKGYEIQLITTREDIILISNEIIEFLDKEEKHSYNNNPFFILAECERDPLCNPFILIFRKHGKITSYSNGFIEKTTFKLSLSVKKIPTLTTRTLRFSRSAITFASTIDTLEHIIIFLGILQHYRDFFDIISLEEIELRSPLWKYAIQHCTSSGSFFRIFSVSVQNETTSRHDLKENYESWYRSLKAKTRKRISWEKNRFEKRAPGPIIIQKITSDEQVREFIHKVGEIREASWQGKIFDLNKHPPEKDVLYFQRVAQYGWLRSYLLLCANKPAAYELAIQYNQECIFLERGYRLDMRNFAPGTYLTYKILEDCYATNPPKSINFGFGENAFKKRLRTTTEDSCYAYLTMPGRWRTLVRCQIALNVMEQFIRHLLKTMQLDRRVRKLLKQQK